MSRNVSESLVMPNDEPKILTCPSCGAPVEVPNLCVYCGHRLYIEGMDRDMRLRDLVLEERVFRHLRDLGREVGIEVRFALEPSDGLHFAYFAKKVGAGERDWRRVGGLEYQRSLSGAEYRLVAECREAARSVSWLRVKSYTQPDNTRLYECGNDGHSFLAATLTIDDIGGSERNPVWLMLVTMLNRIDPTAANTLKENARTVEKSRQLVSESHRADLVSLHVRMVDEIEKAVERARDKCNRGYEFGDDPGAVEYEVELAKYFLWALESLSSFVGEMDVADIDLSGLIVKFRDDIRTHLGWLEEIEEEKFGRVENTRKLKKNLEAFQSRIGEVGAVLSRMSD